MSGRLAKSEAPGDLFIAAKRFKLSYNFCASNLTSLFVPGVRLQSARRYASSYLGD